jgi:hypothetical protein
MTNGMVASPASSASSATATINNIEANRPATPVASVSDQAPRTPTPVPTTTLQAQSAKRGPGRPPKMSAKAQNLQRARQVLLDGKPKRKVSLKEVSTVEHHTFYFLCKS